jgi:hypothetical protein
MSEKGSSGTADPKLKSSGPICSCELTVDEKGRWELRPESSTECITTVESMASSLGPNSREYLATHIAPGTPEMEKVVKKLKDSNQRAE